MSITLDANQSFLKVKIIGKNYEKDKLKLAAIHDKRAVWKMTDFLYWELPLSRIKDLTDAFSEDEIICKSDEARRQLKAYFGASGGFVFDPYPEHIQSADGRVLKEFQKKYISITLDKAGLILGTEQGLGKTKASLLRAFRYGAKKLLVVGSKAIIKTAGEWESEIVDTLGIRAFVYHGNKVQRLKQREQFENYSIILTTYAFVPEIVKHTPSEYFDHLILDEAHCLHDPDTKTSKDVERLVFIHLNSCSRQLLTGTPIWHKPRSLWNLVHLAAPHIAGDYWQWRNRYEKVTATFDKKIQIYGKDGKPKYDAQGNPLYRIMKIPLKIEYQNLDELTKRVMGVVIFRVERSKHTTFEDLYDLVTLELTPKQKDFYDQIQQELLEEFDSRNWGKDQAATKMLRLLQAAEGMFNFDEANLESSKLDYVINELDSATGKVIVWSRFKPITKILHEKYKGRLVLWNGDVSDARKKLAKWAFQGLKHDYEREEFERLKARYPEFSNYTPGSAQFFSGVIDPLAKSVSGLNFQVCDYQIITSLDWNHNANMQVGDRIKRLDTPWDKVVTKIIHAGKTIEKDAYKLILENYKLGRLILDGKSSKDYNQTQDLIKLLRKRY